MKGASDYYVSIKGKFLIIIEVVLALILCRLPVDQVIYTQTLFRFVNPYEKLDESEKVSRVLVIILI